VAKTVSIAAAPAVPLGNGRLDPLGKGRPGEPLGRGRLGDPLGKGSDGEPLGRGSSGDPLGNGSDGEPCALARPDAPGVAVAATPAVGDTGTSCTGVAVLAEPQATRAASSKPPSPLPMTARMRPMIVPPC
jgi:hypothetical protein